VREAVRCPSAVLIVVCPDPREADKCRQVIPMGHPGWDLRPIVIDPLHAPDSADADPYLILFLACLPTLDMESEEGAPPGPGRDPRHRRLARRPQTAHRHYP
jgi:hypothetical protein